MGTTVTPYTAEHVAAVKAFNDRMRGEGAAYLLPESHIPQWLPKTEDSRIHQEYFVAVDNGMVRGGYILKSQPFMVNGQELTLAQYRLPLSEGQIDKQFASLGVQLYLDAVRRQPHMYTVGIGGYQEAFAKLLISAGWKTCVVPFYFRVLHAGPFLRNIVYLRTTRARRIALDTLATTGLGAVAVQAYQALKTRGRTRDRREYTVSLVSSFGDWADSLWDTVRNDSSLIAVRDSSILNVLYPADDPRWNRLQVTLGGRVVGWCVVLNVPMHDHNYFGDMRVGSLIDCLALEGMESVVARAALVFLQEQGADIAVTNLSHARWLPALESAGFYQGPSNFIFAASKKVAAMLDPFEAQSQRIHMTRGDGAGAENLLAAVKYANQIPVTAGSS